VAEHQALAPGRGFAVEAIDQLAICVTDVSSFNTDLSSNGGYMFVEGLLLKYLYASTFHGNTGASFLKDPLFDASKVPFGGTPNIVPDQNDQLTVKNMAKLLVNQPYDTGPNSTGFTYKKWPNGLSVVPSVSVENTASIAKYGVHEYVFRDPGLPTFKDLIAAAQSDVAKWGLPITKITYTTTDNKSVVGAKLRADMAYPLVHEDFVIQSVTITHDEFEVRYDVTADTAARNTFNDLLLKLDDARSTDAPMSGVVKVATDKATSNIPTSSTGATLQQASGTLTAAQVSTLATTPVNIITAPGAGKIIVPVSLYAYSSVTGTQASSAGPQIVYTGRTTNLCGATVNWNNAIGETEQIQFANVTDGSNAGALLNNVGLDIRGNFNGNSAGVGVYKYLVTYYIVTRP